MPNRRKKWVKPGELSRQVQASNYLLKRNNTIKQNAEKLASLGLQLTARDIFGSAKGTNENGKKNVIGNDKDDNYIPTEDDDVDDETSWSQSDEAEKALWNSIGIFKLSNISGKRHNLVPTPLSDDNSDADSESSSDEKDDNNGSMSDPPVLQLRKVTHDGCVNRIRSMNQQPHICATWADTGNVQALSNKSAFQRHQQWLQHGKTRSA